MEALSFGKSPLGIHASQTKMNLVLIFAVNMTTQMMDGKFCNNPIYCFVVIKIHFPEAPYKFINRPCQLPNDGSSIQGFKTRTQEVTQSPSS